MECRPRSVDACDLVQRLRKTLKDTNTTPGLLCDLFNDISSYFNSSSFFNDDDDAVQEADVYAIKACNSIIELLLDHYTIEWNKKDEHNRSPDSIFENILVHGSRESVVSALVSRISSMPQGLKCLRFISLLEVLIKKEKFLLKLISSKCRNNSIESTRQTQRASDVQWQSTLSLITSLPDIILPKSHLHSSFDFFQPQAYISSLCDDFQSVLQTVYTKLQKSESCSVAFLAALLGKLCATGYGALFWADVLRRNESIIANDFLHQRIWQKIIIDVPDRWLEQSVVPLIMAASSSQTLKCFLGSIPLKKPKLNFLFTNKLLVVRYYESSHVVQNFICYLASDKELQSLFNKAFEAVMQAWADGSSLRHRPHEQSLYICKAVIVCVACMQRDVDLVKDVSDVIRKSVLGGLSQYLDSSEPLVRQMGCFVAEKLSPFIKVSDNSEHVLTFNLVPDDITEALDKLLTLPEQNKSSNNVILAETVKVSTAVTHSSGIDSTDISKSKESANKSSGMSEYYDSRGKCKTTKPPIKLIQELDSDDDDDDELKPMPLSSNDLPRNKKQPMYISQCLDGLIHAGDDAELVEQCLANAESLVRNHSEVKEIAAEMTKVLLHLEDRFSLSDFMLNRRRTMIALAVMSPETVVPYMTGELYARNYNISQRMDILDVLSAAARELSNPLAEPKSKSDCTLSIQLGNQILNSTASDVNQSNVSIVKSWQEVVQERIESKTRRFAHGPVRPPPIATANKLSRVVGLFFYPLMRDFDRTDRGDHLDLIGRDHILLERLLNTLGVIMYAATNTSEARAMARALVEFSWCLRGHPRSSVRQGVLYAVCMAMAAVPGAVLMESLEEELAEVRSWLDDVRCNDADTECRQLAQQSLYLLCSTVQKQFNSSLL